jgi:hypothetical protein
MAEANCRIPTTTNGDCWLKTYSQMHKGCQQRGTQLDCSCAARATEMCESSATPANDCYNDLYRKCMAGRVAGYADPDRNNNFLNA